MSRFYRRSKGISGINSRNQSVFLGRKEFPHLIISLLRHLITSLFVEQASKVFKARAPMDYHQSLPSLNLHVKTRPNQQVTSAFRMAGWTGKKCGRRRVRRRGRDKVEPLGLSKIPNFSPSSVMNVPQRDSYQNLELSPILNLNTSSPLEPQCDVILYWLNSSFIPISRRVCIQISNE